MFVTLDKSVDSLGINIKEMKVIVEYMLTCVDSGIIDSIVALEITILTSPSVAECQ